jgi:hypothetical protein
MPKTEPARGLSPLAGSAERGVTRREQEEVMGRTAIAFLILAAVGGCVADDQGPLARFPGAPGQDGAAPTYTKWSRAGDQFAALHDNQAAVPMPQVVTVPAGTQPNTTTAQKPASLHKTVVAAPQPAAPAQGSADVVVDSQLAAATMVTVPADKTSTDTVKAPSHSNPDADSPPSDPASPAIRMVNSKRVTLNYELKDVGASGVSGVELWCTHDTKSWTKGEIVAQTSHSFTVEVKEEGLYGFTLLARNGAGIGKDAPAPGEQPQVWVTVDVTKPTVQICSVEIDRAAKTPTVEIHWVAKDKNLGPKPITLSYAEQPDGPWTPIAAGIENTGQHEWQPPATAPRCIYLKVEAVDLPGNTASAQTANPLRLDAAAAAVVAPPPDATHAGKTLPAPPALDTSRPSAAISGVEPNGN